MGGSQSLYPNIADALCLCYNFFMRITSVNRTAAVPSIPRLPSREVAVSAVPGDVRRAARIIEHPWRADG
ncbi:hypothetical protein B296_00050446 [Ensete ventricosum]|uniref:Uncharacterized protein n=1 Tax=Ensete ventricosum TaxID=4639 RepID=A0A426XR73_ENSVE|nr:hypothetical protein B296_00050446 [Ensete ventricosum]